MADDPALTGRVLRGINTIYDVATARGVLRCRIKGKVLRTGARHYNPIAPGDVVTVEPDPATPGTGKITSLLARRTMFARWNQKGRATQVMAANANLAACVTTTRLQLDDLQADLSHIQRVMHQAPQSSRVKLD